MTRRNTTSASATNIPRINTVTITTIVESTNSLRVGQDDFFNSPQTSTTKSRTLRNGFAMSLFVIAFAHHRDPASCSSPSWHARRDLNPQPTVLETVALPIELLTYPHCGLVRLQPPSLLLRLAKGNVLP